MYRVLTISMYSFKPYKLITLGVLGSNPKRITGPSKSNNMMLVRCRTSKYMDLRARF